MTNNFWPKATRVFDYDEDTRSTPYKDTKGLWTIGRGHLIGKDLKKLRLSDKVIEAMFHEDFMIAFRDAGDTIGWPVFQALNEARQIACASMLFTLGKDKWLHFGPTIAAIQKGKWDEVADRVLAAKWATDVDPRKRKNEGRDDRIAYMFRNGKFHPDYMIEE